MTIFIAPDDCLLVCQKYSNAIAIKVTARKTRNTAVAVKPHSPVSIIGRDLQWLQIAVCSCHMSACFMS
jgi:hypothetical protein